jgi:hypothetical protein
MRLGISEPVNHSRMQRMSKRKGKGRNQSVPASQWKYEGRNNTKRAKKEKAVK